MLCFGFLRALEASAAAVLVDAGPFDRLEQAVCGSLALRLGVVGFWLRLIVDVESGSSVSESMVMISGDMIGVGKAKRC